MALVSQEFYGGRNALALYNFKTGDSDKLYGFSLDTGVTGSVAGEVQTVTSGVQGDGIKAEEQFFPFEGAKLIASADFSNAGGRFRIGIRFLDANKATLSESYSDYIATGRRSHEVTVPANTVYVQWYSVRDEVDGTDYSWEFTKPALRTISSTFSN